MYVRMRAEIQIQFRVWRASSSSICLPPPFIYPEIERNTDGFNSAFSLSPPPPPFRFFSFRTLQAKGERKKVFTSLSLSLSLSFSLSLSLATIESRQYRGGEGGRRQSKPKKWRRRRRRKKTSRRGGGGGGGRRWRQSKGGKENNFLPLLNPTQFSENCVSSLSLSLSSQRWRRAQDLTIPKTFLLKREPQQPPGLKNRC